MKYFLSQFNDSELSHIRTATINSGRPGDELMNRVVQEMIKTIDRISQDRADKMIKKYLDEHGTHPHFV